MLPVVAHILAQADQFTPTGYMATYGPLAFGVVTFLVIWFAVVMPMLKLNKGDRDKDLAIANAYNETAEALKATADAMRQTTIAAVQILRESGVRQQHQTNSGDSPN